MGERETQHQTYTGSIIIGANTSGSSNDIIPLALGGGYVKFFTGNSETTLTSTITVNDNKSYILFCSRNMLNGARNLMINNANGVSDNLGGTVLLNTNPQVAFGGDSNPVATMYNGEISEVVVYNRILSSEERTAIAQYLAKKYAIKL